MVQFATRTFLVVIVFHIGTISGDSFKNDELSKFPPPSRLQSPLHTEFRQIHSSAPPDPYPRSHDALQLPLLSIFENATEEIMGDIKAGLQYVFQTRSNFTLGLHGTGTTGMSAVLDNLIAEGDKVLALVNGYWGELMAHMSERFGGHVVRYKKTPGTVFSLQEIESAMKGHRPNIVTVVQGESSTTVSQPMEGIGELCTRYGSLLVVDVVAAAGIQPVLMDYHKIDAVFAGSQKGIGSVAGMAVVSLSPRAIEKVLGRRYPPRAYQTDLSIQSQVWNGSGFIVNSLSLPLMYAMREALATIAEEGIENVFRRHERATRYLTEGLESLGLEHFVENPNDRLIGITAVRPPPNKDPYKIANHMFQNFKVEISTGLGPTSGQVLRIATFGSNADISRIKKLLTALRFALNSRETTRST